MGKRSWSGAEQGGVTMTDQGGSGRTLTLTTDALDPRDRIEIWRESVGRAAMSLDIDPLPDAIEFHAALTSRALPGLVVSECTHGGMHYDRRSSMTDSDDLVLSIVRQGSHVVRQLGEELMLSPGEAVLNTSEDAGLSFNLAAERVLLLRFPRGRIAPLVGDIGGTLMRKIRSGAPALQVLVSYSSVVSSLSMEAPPDLLHTMAAQLCDLVALALGPTRDAAQAAKERGVRAARLHSVKQEIARSVFRCDLSAGDIAASQRISVSYLRKLFEGDGTTFTDFVLGQRLQQAHRLVTDPRFAALNISALAYDAGFGDLSYFNRVFRRRYGCTPSEARARAREGLAGAWRAKQGRP